MKSSVLADQFHVAIIMDGNGRWASKRSLPRHAGHRAGSRTVRRIVEAAVRFDIDVLTLYAFSSDNWSRPEDEVNALLRLFERFLRSECRRCVENGVRVNVIGRRDRLAPKLVKAIEQVEDATAGGTRLLLRLAVDYSARHAISTAAKFVGDNASETFIRALRSVIHAHDETPDVDLLIRTGGEKRLSDFLLWECAYAELYFTDCFWPEFSVEDLTRAMVDFRSRERRFGRLLYAAP